tara:strand:+ start:14238 stop:14624 length:387 start_codon:yes stop_codon:yes gene_type:complete
MPTLTLTFSNDINTSAQVGDTAYFVNSTSPPLYDFGMQGQNSDIIELGPITDIIITTSNNITKYSIKVLVSGNVVQPTPNQSLILFSKDNAVNMSSPLGYFAKAKVVNNSKIKSEIFSISCEVFESSK